MIVGYSNCPLRNSSSKKENEKKAVVSESLEKKLGSIIWLLLRHKDDGAAPRHLLLVSRHQPSTQQEQINTISKPPSKQTRSQAHTGTTASKHTRIWILEGTLLGAGNGRGDSAQR